MSNETRQPTTVIEFTQPWNATWSGHERNNTAISETTTAALQTIVFNIIKGWEDTRSIGFGIAPTTIIHPHGYERIVEVTDVVVLHEHTKTKHPTGHPRSFNWEGDGTAKIKVRSFSELAPK